MKSDREGHEDTRCCDTKPGTVFFLLLLCTEETAGRETGPFVKQNRNNAEES